MPSLGDFLSSINYNKKDLIKQDPLAEKDYLPFVTNRCLSYFPDTVFYANQMNLMPHLDKKMQYDYLREKLSRRSRFSKWTKQEENPDIDAIKQYYGYSIQKAKQILPLLSNEQIAIIKSHLNTGGHK
jgi:hypothetical protein